VPSAARHALALSCALLLSALGCAGCTLVETPKPVSCSWTDSAQTASTSAAASNTVVLIDTSASFWPRKGGSASLPDSEQEAAGELLRDFGQAGTQLVSLGTFNGTSTTISWQLADAPLPAPAGTADAISRQRDGETACLDKVIGRAEQTAPAIGGTDVMAALDAAGTKLGSTSPGHSEVLVITDGLSNTGCLNFNQVMSQGENATDVVRSCRGQGGLAHLRGVSVKLAGIGLQAQAEPLTSSEQSWLVGYWRELCSDLGVAASQSCVMSQGSTRPDSSDVSRPSDPRVSFPVVTGPVVVVRSPLLFAFDSSTLTQTAQSYLDILIQEIRGSGQSVTRIVGHTDRAGSAAYNLSLSLRRAQAVQDYLAARGFTGIKASGVGFAQSACASDYTASGQLNPKCMAKDRRVVIFLGGHK
jgi:OOP family OmpA-OmpF porin